MKRYSFIYVTLFLVVTCRPSLNGQQASTSAVEGYIGVSTRGNPRTRSNGIELSSLDRGGPADDAGIRPGDIVISIDCRFPASIEELRDLVHGFQPGERVDVSYRRGTLISETYIIVGPTSVAQAGGGKARKTTADRAKVDPADQRPKSAAPRERSLRGTPAERSMA